MASSRMVGDHYMIAKRVLFGGRPTRSQKTEGERGQHEVVVHFAGASLLLRNGGHRSPFLLRRNSSGQSTIESPTDLLICHK